MDKINVNLLGKDLSLSCDPEDRDLLLEAVKQADELMTQIHEAKPKLTYERVALMASIEFSRQLLAVQSTAEGPFEGITYGDVKSRLDNIHSMLDSAIDKLK